MKFCGRDMIQVIDERLTENVVTAALEQAALNLNGPRILSNSTTAMCGFVSFQTADC